MSICFPSPNRNRTLEWHSGSAVLCRGCQTDTCRWYLSILIKTESVKHCKCLCTVKSCTCKMWIYISGVSMWITLNLDGHLQQAAVVALLIGQFSLDELISWCIHGQCLYKLKAQFGVWCFFMCQMLWPSLMSLRVKQELHFCGAIAGQLLGSFFSPAWTSAVIMLTVWFHWREAGWALGFHACLVKAQNQNKLNPERIPCLQKPCGKRQNCPKGRLTCY